MRRMTKREDGCFRTEMAVMFDKDDGIAEHGIAERKRRGGGGGGKVRQSRLRIGNGMSSEKRLGTAHRPQTGIAPARLLYQCGNRSNARSEPFKSHAHAFSASLPSLGLTSKAFPPRFAPKNQIPGQTRNPIFQFQFELTLSATKEERARLTLDGGQKTRSRLLRLGTLLECGRTRSSTFNFCF